jgi:hypothetical protein
MQCLFFVKIIGYRACANNYGTACVLFWFILQNNTTAWTMMRSSS